MTVGSIGKSLILGLILAPISSIIVEPLLRLSGSPIRAKPIFFLLIIAPLMMIISQMPGPEIETIKTPNQGIWESLKAALIFALIGATTLGLSAFLMREQLFVVFVSWMWKSSGVMPSFVLSPVQTAGLVLPAILVGLCFGLSQAGTACIQHFSLRVVLYCKGFIPWNYARFLNYATQRMILQRVGGRYRFIHRLLQDHFANMGQ